VGGGDAGVISHDLVSVSPQEPFKFFLSLTLPLHSRALGWAGLDWTGTVQLVQYSTYIE